MSEIINEEKQYKSSINCRIKKQSNILKKG